MTSARLGSALLGGSALLAACVGTPRVSGVPGASPAPQVAWTPPPDAARGLTRGDTGATTQVPADLSERIRRLTLAEIVDIGLRNNASTRLAWANAQAAAAAYGSQRGEWLPTIDGDVTAARIKTVASQGRTAVQQSVLAPSVTLSYLVFDFGGRTGRIERRARAACWPRGSPTTPRSRTWCSRSRWRTSSISPPARCSTRSGPRSPKRGPTSRRRRSAGGSGSRRSPTCSRPAPRPARRSSISSRPRATCRPPAGHSHWRWACPRICRTTSTRTAAGAPVRALADSVDALIASALRGRPDLAAARSEAGRRARRASATLAADLLPSLNLSATGGRTYATTIPNGANSYNLSLGLSIPIFNGFSRQYDLRAAEYQAEAGVGPERDHPPAGRLPGVQRLLRAADRDPPGRHRRGPDRERAAVERGGPGALQGRRRQRARPAGGPERAGRRARAAGGRPAGLERLAGAAGARCGRARPAGRIRRSA